MIPTEYINSNIITQTDGGQAGSDLKIRNELVMENLFVVTQVMKRTVARLPRAVEADDVWSAGVLGLIDAARKFDGAREVRFRTYAETRVRGAMLDYLRSLSWAPRGLHRMEKEIDRARELVERRTCRGATAPEIADELGINIGDCHRLLDRVNRLDWSDSDELREDVADAAGRASPAAHLERKELLELIWKAVDLLPERQKLVLWLYYGEEMNMKEVGAVLEVNEARASQLHSKAIQGLRSEMSSRLKARKTTLSQLVRGEQDPSAGREHELAAKSRPRNHPRRLVV